MSQPSYENDYYRVEMLPGHRIILVIRKSRAFDSAASVNLACEPVQVTLDRLDRPSHALLVDTRLAPLRNDPEYEARWAEHRRAMVMGFRRVAILAATEAGRLQTKRLIVEDGIAPQAFSDMREAISFLEGGEGASLPPPSRPSQSAMARVRVPRS